MSTTDPETQIIPAPMPAPAALVVNQTPSLLDPGVLDQAVRLARIFQSSGMLPAHLNEAAVIVGLSIAHRSGQDPLWVLQNLYVVKGTYGWSAKYLLAQVNGSGRFAGPVRFETTGSGSSLAVTAWAVLAYDGSRVESTVSLKMAQDAGWTRNPIYKSIPEQMLSYRAATFLCRLYCPEVLSGLYTANELRDVQASRGNEPQQEQRIQVVADDLGQRFKRALAAFSKIGITQADLESRLGHTLADWGPDQLFMLRSMLEEEKRDRAQLEAAPPVADVGPVGADDAAPVEPEAPAPQAAPAKPAATVWSKAQAIEFTDRLKARGLDYQAVCDLVQEKTGRRPSQLASDRRARLLEWLQGDGYRPAIRAFEIRSGLLDRAQALTVAERKAAALAAGLEGTAPGKMSANDLRALLGAAELGSEE